MSAGTYLDRIEELDAELSDVQEHLRALDRAGDRNPAYRAALKDRAAALHRALEEYDGSLVIGGAA